MISGASGSTGSTCADDRVSDTRSFDVSFINH